MGSDQRHFDAVAAHKVGVLVCAWICQLLSFGGCNTCQGSVGCTSCLMALQDCSMQLSCVQAPGERQWLVLRLQQYIDTGFKLATGQAEALKSAGLEILQASSHATLRLVEILALLSDGNVQTLSAELASWQCLLQSSSLLHMQAALVHFAASEDPQLEGYPLLEQYQAQFIAALRRVPCCSS